MGDAWYWTAPPPTDLDQWLVCSWWAEPSGLHLLTPDGCSDLLCTTVGPALLCGPEHRSWSFELPPGVTAVGIRFRAGQVRALFDLDVDTLTDRQVPLSTVVGNLAAEELGPCGDPDRSLDDRRLLLLAWFRRWSAEREPDPVSVEISDAVITRPGISQDELAAQLGMSPRTLRRQAQVRFGYGTATLTRLVRFQRLIALSLTAPDGTSLGRLAAEAGYADHAHLVRDCRAISDRPPSEFLAAHFPTFPDLTDPYKTGAPFVPTMGT